MVERAADTHAHRYNPDLRESPPDVCALREPLRNADATLVKAP